MKRNAFAAISHKGGTGRSVTLANVAFRLALKGYDICCVDLDLTSPTLGSVLGIAKLETGVEKEGSQVAPRSIFDILNRGNDAQKVINMCDTALVDVWGASGELQVSKPIANPIFRLLPGFKNINDDVLELSRLPLLLEALSDRYHVVILDVRSGNSKVADALASPECDPYIDSWLLHFRWTRQHLAGVANYVSSFQKTHGRFDDRVLLISTAYPQMSPQSSDALRRELHAYNDQLEARLQDLCGRLGHDILGKVPFEDLLLWKETVITDKMVERRIARAETSESFGAIADAILKRLEVQVA